MVASFREMSSNLFSESERVAFDSESCLSRLSMASSLEDTPFSSSILFLTLWSALKQAPASSRVALARRSSCFSLFSCSRIRRDLSELTSPSALPALQLDPLPHALVGPQTG